MKTTLFDAMVNSLKGKMEHALILKNGNMEAAIEYVKQSTTAGPKVWDAVLADLSK